jgi:hypothetical protein
MVNGNFSSSVSYNFLFLCRTAGAIRFRPSPRSAHRGARAARHRGRRAGGTGLSSARAVAAARHNLKLEIAVDRNHAVVGEPIRMTVRFFQGVQLRPIPTTGPRMIPILVRARESRALLPSDAGGRWLVSETRTFPIRRYRDGWHRSARMQCAVSGD